MKMYLVRYRNRHTDETHNDDVFFSMRAAQEYVQKFNDAKPDFVAFVVEVPVGDPKNIKMK